MPAGSRLAPVADVADGQSRDGGPELVTRGEHPVIAMPVLREGGPGAVPQQVFETPKIAGHIAVDERDPDK